MRTLKVRGLRIDDSFAEAFPMSGTAVVITAPTLKWARQAAATMTGFATSVIACGCEGGIDCNVSARDTPDGRPGVRVLFFAMSPDALQTQLMNRLGQCVLTCPGTACYADIKGEKRLKLGSAIRYFADGWQISKKFGGKQYWRMPVMEGEFVCEAMTGLTSKAVGGGNLLIMGANFDNTLRAAEAAVSAIEKVKDAIMPFPGGIVRSGSKVGSKYKALIASTNHFYCPTLKGSVDTALDDDIGCVLEIVIDGLDVASVEEAMRRGLHAAAQAGARYITAGNYGGTLGQYKIKLHDLLNKT
jgi:formylmethanofuran--tetrahydromethanopterin N-formyltransferase